MCAHRMMDGQEERLVNPSSSSLSARTFLDLWACGSFHFIMSNLWITGWMALSFSSSSVCHPDKRAAFISCPCVKEVAIYSPICNGGDWWDIIRVKSTGFLSTETDDGRRGWWQVVIMSFSSVSYCNLLFRFLHSFPLHFPKFDSFVRNCDLLQNNCIYIQNSTFLIFHCWHHLFVQFQSRNATQHHVPCKSESSHVRNQ